MRTIRYRLFLVVETPEGEKTGSSVMQEQVRWNDGLVRGLGSGPGVSMRYNAEATVVDLGSRGKIFCLLQFVQPLRQAFDFREWSYHGWLNSGDDSYLRFIDNLNARRPTANMNIANLPMLIRFRDIADPKTVEQVDPSDLAAAFGMGVRLKNASMQITGDLPTNGIERTLPWLDHLPTGSITGITRWDPARPDQANYLTVGNFRDRVERFNP